MSDIGVINNKTYTATEIIYLKTMGRNIKKDKMTSLTDITERYGHSYINLMFLLSF